MKKSCTFAPDLDISHCCEMHDIHYATGQYTRKQADEIFFQCIKGSGRPIIAYIYYYAVRLFGWMRYKK